MKAKGDISVLHHEDKNIKPDNYLLDNLEADIKGMP
jgi:hypothetical protein